MRGVRGVAVAPCPLLPVEVSRGLLVGVVYLVLVILATASTGPHIPDCLARSFMMYAGLMALACVAVVDHARSAHHQTTGSGPGLGPLCTRPRSWGEGGVNGFLPSPLEFLLAHHPSRGGGGDHPFGGVAM